jgi:hypothetical protein
VRSVSVYSTYSLCVPLWFILLCIMAVLVIYSTMCARSSVISSMHILRKFQSSINYYRYIPDTNVTFNSLKFELPSSVCVNRWRERNIRVIFTRNNIQPLYLVFVRTELVLLLCIINIRVSVYSVSRRGRLLVPMFRSLRGICEERTRTERSGAAQCCNPRVNALYMRIPTAFGFLGLTS